IQRLKDLLSTFASSTPIQAPTPKAEKVFYLYTPSAGQKEKTENYLTQLANSLDRENEAALIETIHSMQWIDASQSFLFQGTDPSIQRLKDLLSTFASSTPIQAPTPKTGYSIYKLQNATVDQMEEDLDKLAKDLSETTVSDKNLIAAIEQIRYVKETNSLLLTGDATVIEELKNIIAQYDHPQTATEPVNSDFFMYKPQHLQAQEIEKSLQDIGSSLQQAGLADASLLRAISSAKYVATTNSIIFTGNTESLQKIQTLLQEIDVPPKTHAPIQHVGKTTFLLYKLKHAGGTQIVSAIRSMEEDLKKSGNADKEFLAALDSMKYVKETNSLLFTGTEPALTKVEALLSGYDVTSLAAPAPAEKPTPSPASTNFFVYRPTAVPGVELERMVYDFAENLKMSGLSDPDLFNAIASMRWVEKTQSLIFTGTPRSLEQIQTLLKDFDNPANLREEAPSGTAIQAIDNTSFLVYKLQFHRGDEIQSALRQIAKDLANTNAPVNQNLLHAIQSIQWLDVTNSLLCSGDQETLTRLKELIKNLDIPLKQVFIEILVIETSLTNALNFGLEWGANYNFNNKFGASSYNTLPPPNAQSVFPDTFITNLGKLEPPATPTPIGNIPANVGFDLGVIGEVIKHNGQTFLTLGSLLTALQQDTETTIVNTPKILAQDGRTSVFFSGSNIPFTGSFVNNTQSGATIQTSNLEYRDIGLKLMITPVLGNSDIVTLDINLDREQTATDINQTALNFSSQTANGIVTSKTSMQTTVHVPDRNFLVLSGFVNNSNTKQKSGIPCLGGLPLIGAAFSKSNDTISSQNIVIFLRPYILNSIEDMRKMTAEQEEYFREQSPTPFLEHNYNDSLELLKTIDDD
ncbi:MAG TPA: secretin N-terminal domain-containing protein, partial [Chlamydiales bacterium]|nr:secretin N-terminal domain-containing protein [Chlamydiales bacterium]